MYFTIEELEKSETAIKNGINNTSNGDVRVNLTHLIELLDKIRTKWGHPIRVTSGYRCQKLNKLVGGVPNSQHVLGEAADITVGSTVDNKRLFEMIVGMDILFDQLILEDGGKWIHISYKKEIDKNRKEILVATRNKNGKMCYTKY